MKKISNGNWTEWNIIQGVIGRVIENSAKRVARGRFEITSNINNKMQDCKIDVNFFLLDKNVEDILYQFCKQGRTHSPAVELIDARATLMSNYSYAITQR